MRNCNCNRTCRQNNCGNNFNNRFNNCTTLNNNSSAFPRNYMYGHCYTPNQTLSKIFSPTEGLKNGTMFPELVSPYCPGQSMEEIQYLRSRNGGRCNVQ